MNKISNNDVIFYDLETPKGCFLASFLINGKWKDFLINQYKNDLPALLKFFESNKDKYFCAFNGIGFDCQVVEYIWKHQERLLQLDNLECAREIYQFAQDVIETSHHGGYLPFREEFFNFKCIDPRTILHLDNKNRMASGSLKHIEYYLDMSIETFDISPHKEDFTEEEVENLIKYCHHDVEAVKKLYYLVRGETENALYKENDQIQLRLDIQEEFGIPCLNYSDSKIGDEIIKKYYCDKTNIEYKNLPKKGTFRKEIKLKHCIPEYIQFETPELKKLLEKLKSTIVTKDDSFSKELNLFGLKIQMGEGGLHSVNNLETYIADDVNKIKTIDANSFYPAIGVERGYYPFHLKKIPFQESYREIYEKRITLKPLAKKDKRIKGIVGALKLAANSVYGKSSDMTSWLYDRQMMLQITITGQLSLLMLTEMLYLQGIKTISQNTDGIEVIYSDEALLQEIVEKWEKITNFTTEQVNYEAIFYSTVNDYIAIVNKDDVKCKGDFTRDVEIHKNKSKRIVPLALYEYFVNKNENIEEFINSHNVLLDFCIRANVNKNFRIEHRHAQKVDVYNKILRYYVSKDGGKMFKVKKPECTTNAPDVSEMSSGNLCTIVNDLSSINEQEHLLKVDRNYYIDEVNKILLPIKLGRKLKNKVEIKEQLKLF